jgi:small nuclear ribonucleoprotein (snRNP)-like protein
LESGSDAAEVGVTKAGEMQRRLLRLQGKRVVVRLKEPHNERYVRGVYEGVLDHVNAVDSYSGAMAWIERDNGSQIGFPIGEIACVEGS